MTLAQFRRSAPAGAASTTPARKASKYAGIRASAPRDPIPHAGWYRFRVVKNEEGYNPGEGKETWKASFEILDLDERGAQNHAIGDTVTAIEVTNGKGGNAGLGRVKSYIMATAGFDNEAEYDDFDPKGLFIEACAGIANEFSAKGLTNINRLVECTITKGQDKADKDGVHRGDYWRNYSWHIVAEEEQPQPEAPAEAQEATA